MRFVAAEALLRGAFVVIAVFSVVAKPDMGGRGESEIRRRLFRERHGTGVPQMCRADDSLSIRTLADPPLACQDQSVDP
ncbi:MAG: hypothetical protein ACREE3_07615 [Stellaceae bacterium]